MVIITKKHNQKLTLDMYLLTEHLHLKFEISQLKCAT